MHTNGDQSPAHLRFAVLASDVVLFTIHEGTLLVRVTRVDRPPYFPNTKGLPGGLIDPTETAEEAAARLLKDKACISPSGVHLEQLYTFSAIDRDPRGRVVAVAYIGLVPWESLGDTERANTPEAWWANPETLQGLAYDHDQVLDSALKRLRSRVTYTTIMSKLMPAEFTLTELESAYESILATDLDKRNFRKKILKLNVLKPLKRKRTGGRFRPAELYAFMHESIHDIELI
jgi:8-oxo-dGTP diphosphatase